MTDCGTSAAVQFEAVHKRFAGHAVLDGVDLTLPQGATMALVGINGAGKTTCLKSLLDFCSIDAGAIRIAGTPHGLPRARAALFFLPERFGPPGFLTGSDYLCHTARLHGTGATAAVDIAAELEFPDGALARPVRDYSKGMVQKIGLAAAFASARPILILDEPMSGLDPKARVLVKRRIERERAAGRTVFITTHMLADAEAFCDRMAVLHRGRVAFAGAPAECRDRFGGGDLETAFLNCLAAEDARHSG